MDTAAKILVIGGLVSLVYAFVMGFVLSQVRLKDHMIPQPRLLNVHVVALWEGFMLLGLVFGVVLSNLSSGVETAAALLLIAGGFFQLFANTIAWTQKLEDLFAPPHGAVYSMAVINAILHFAGLIILTFGAIKAL